jgi:hypothetical protein
VRSSRNHAGGFAPGLASSLSLHDGRRVFVKATPILITEAVTAILAADAGFLIAGARTGPPGRVADAKRHPARGATAWLRRRLALL